MPASKHDRQTRIKPGQACSTSTCQAAPEQVPSSLFSVAHEKAHLHLGGRSPAMPAKSKQASKQASKQDTFVFRLEGRLLDSFKKEKEKEKEKEKVTHIHTHKQTNTQTTPTHSHTNQLPANLEEELQERELCCAQVVKAMLAKHLRGRDHNQNKAITHLPTAELEKTKEWGSIVLCGMSCKAALELRLKGTGEWLSISSRFFCDKKTNTTHGVPE